nr:Hint domain-containing protein [Roseomonas acroporae]
MQRQAQTLLQEASQIVSTLCFLHGTRILTTRGEVAVESLRIGDEVVTPGGPAATMPIRWIGRQHRDGLQALCMQPVRIRAGALGEGMPHRDLLVSADHCLHLDGHLVPAKLLVNGVTILAEAGHATVDYVNIELDRHAVVLAEGAETESYLDCGNRARFDNAGEPCEWLDRRGPRDWNAWNDGTAFAPPLWDGPRLDALRARLLARALSDGRAPAARPASAMPPFPAPVAPFPAIGGAPAGNAIAA